jgi:hypothetical protein
MVARGGADQRVPRPAKPFLSLTHRTAGSHPGKIPEATMPPPSPAGQSLRLMDRGEPPLDTTVGDLLRRRRRYPVYWRSSRGRLTQPADLTTPSCWRSRSGPPGPAGALRPGERTLSGRPTARSGCCSSTPSAWPGWSWSRSIRPCGPGSSGTCWPSPARPGSSSPTPTGAST